MRELNRTVGIPEKLEALKAVICFVNDISVALEQEFDCCDYVGFVVNYQYPCLCTIEIHGLIILAQALLAGPGALKIASLGLKVRKGCCYHGVALNLDLDHGPFQQINPCGYPGLGTTDLRAQGIDLPWQAAADMLIDHLHATLYLRESAHHA